MLRSLLLFVTFASASAGQDADTANEFWPEVDVYVKLNPRSRLFFMYTATKPENLGAYSDGQTALYFDYWAVPLLKWRTHITSADASRSKLLLLRNGYQYTRPKNKSGAATEHWITSETHLRFYLPSTALLSDRNRFDLRWVNGGFKWRYRNRLKIERTFRAGRFELTPYAHAEPFYSVDQGDWTRVRWTAGSEWSITKRVVLEGFYTRQNEWRSTPRFINAAGLVLSLYLP